MFRLGDKASGGEWSGWKAAMGGNVEREDKRIQKEIERVKESLKESKDPKKSTTPVSKLF